MKYQDLKVRDIFRILIMFAVFGAVFGLLIIYHVTAEPLLNGIDLPRTHHYLYEIAIGVSGVMAVACFGVVLQYLFTSPEQNARQINKAKKELPPSLLETENPDYVLPTWKYLLRRASKA